MHINMHVYSADFGARDMLNPTKNNVYQGNGIYVYMCTQAALTLALGSCSIPLARPRWLHMCDMTRSCVCDMTRSCVCHVSRVHTCDTTRSCVCVMSGLFTRVVYSFVCVSWPIHMCLITPSLGPAQMGAYVWHASIIYATKSHLRPIHMCVLTAFMTHMCVTDVCHTCVSWHDPLISNR